MDILYVEQTNQAIAAPFTTIQYDICGGYLSTDSYPTALWPDQ